MKDMKIVNAQFYAGQMAMQISGLLQIKNDFEESLRNDCGFNPEEASDMAEKVYESAWKFVNQQGIE